MPAVIQRTAPQAPIHAENETEVNEAEQETYSYQNKPDVVLTGFGQFGKITINPSFQIAQALPATLKSVDGSKIHLRCHPDAVHVGWDAVLKLIPELYTQNANSSEASNPDTSSSTTNVSEVPFFIHIGAGYPGRYHIEQVGHRDGYWKGDVDGKSPPTRKKCGGKGYPCEGEKDPLSPPVLQTGIDVEGVVSDVNKELPRLTMPIATSSDAGNYLCDFIFYTSMREARLRYGNVGLNKVLFVHVPPDGILDEGVRVLGAVIRSIIARGKS